MKKSAIAVASLALVAFLGLAFTASSALAAKKPAVPCDKVMEELNSGKKAKEVAKDLGTTVGHVRYCKAKAKKAAMKAEKEKAAAGAPAAGGAPAPAASPAAPK